MIRIELKDGRVLENQPSRGWNLDNIESINETLETTGSYFYMPARGSGRYIAKDDIMRVYEEAD